MKEKLQEQLETIPKTPGVYLYRDEDGNLLYVGKAVELRNRVRSYFQDSADLGPKTSLMVKQIGNIDYIETESEFTALLLEADLIKKFKPKYNQRFKDDKTYPLIEVTNEKFPRVHITRRHSYPISEDCNGEDSTFFGPYPHGNIRKVLKLLRKTFPFRDCSKNKFSRYQKLGRGCLFAEMNLCSAPCVGNVSEQEYKKMISKLKKFLKGQETKVIEDIEQEMAVYSEQENFEKAAKVRDQLENIKYVRNGYQAASTEELDINLPEDRRYEELRELRDTLSLPNLPERIEAYDISNLQGKQATGSMVVFEEGSAKKSHYRRFKIKQAGEPDDVGMMQEVLQRRFARIEENPGGEGNSTENETPDESFQSIPDLILVDGGKGQLNGALEILKKKRLTIPVLGLAKREEEIFSAVGLGFEDRCKSSLIEGPIKLERGSKALQLLQRVRDESHRFAIAYHKKLRSQELIGE
ncbi:MAG: excinuclease ABC subunit UvrC [Patescibacteria group bacterium]